MNLQELANHLEKRLTIKEENCVDWWDSGWNSAIETVIRIMREQEQID